MNIKAWSMTPEELLESLNTTQKGLSYSEIKKRLGEYGPNSFNKKEKVTFFSVFIKQFASPLVFLLILAAILTGVLGEYIDMFVIILAVLVNTGLGFYREYHAENTLDKLVTYIKDRTRVIRDGKEAETDSVTLVPGDIVKLSYGTRVPADCRLLNVNNLSIDEAILSGESLPVSKNINEVSIASPVVDRNNVAHAGTLVVEGYGTAVVFSTGNETEIGKIANIVSSTQRAETPIQKGIKKLAWLIFIVTVVIVAGIFGLGIIRGEPILEMLLLSAAVAVGAVPEALPIALTIILAIGAEKIASKKGIVRKLAAAETLGSTTLIMTDKTGTLTMADMQLVGIYPSADLIHQRLAEGMKHFSDEQKKLLSLALKNIDVVVENPEEHLKSWKFQGRPFEVNIAKAALKHDVNVDVIKEESKLVLPFSSTYKFSVAEDENHFNVMGAPDILLRRSVLAKDDYLAMEELIDKVSSEGKRLIGIATMHKTVSKHRFTPEKVKDLHFRGILCFYDPIREDVPAALKNIEHLGVKVVLITGDLKGTAMAVTSSLGWHVKEEEVLTGKELNELSDQELSTLIPNVKIFARVTPEDKLRIGTLYRNLGEVVAMTGDGVNDAPALKAMDIGVSLGSGSDVAKSAADMVLLDDNFKTVTLAIEEGRKILANIRKTFVYLMSNSLDAVFVIGGSLLVGLPMPLTALQIIWVNFFTGSLPAIAFAFDENLDKKHGVRGEKGSKIIFTNEVTFITFGIGVASSILLFLVYYLLIFFKVDPDLARSLFFICFSSYILVIAYSFRSLDRPLFSYPIFSNRRLNISILLAVLLIVITVGVPWIRDQFGLVAVPLSWTWLILTWLILNVALIEAAKFIFRMSSRK
jgi:P-type Ca2+ transporter type 2C